MTNQQNTNGFTPIVNELFEKIYQGNFTLREIKIILAVIRYTDGFNRNSAELSLRFLSDAAKIHFSHVQTTVKNLIGKNVLVIESESRGIHSRQLRLNRNYELWNLSINQKSNYKVTESDNTPIGNKSNPSVTGSVNTSIKQKSSTRNNSQLTSSANRALTNLAKPVEDSALTIPAKSTIDQNSQQGKKKGNINKTSSYCFSLPTVLKEVKRFGEIGNSSNSPGKGNIKPLIPAAVKGQIDNQMNFNITEYDIISTPDKSVEFRNMALCSTGLGTPFTFPDYDKYQLKQSKNKEFTIKDDYENDEPGTEPGTTCAQPANNTNNDNNEKEYSLNSDEYRLSSLFYELLKGRINPNHKTPDLQKWYRQNDLIVLWDFQKFKAIIYPRYKILIKVRFCT